VIRSATKILFNRNGTPGSNMGRPSRDERSTTNLPGDDGSATKKGNGAAKEGDGAAWLAGGRRLGGSGGFFLCGFLLHGRCGTGNSPRTISCGGGHWKVACNGGFAFHSFDDGERLQEAVQKIPRDLLPSFNCVERR
jgi:hypothetical protein